MNCSLSSRQSKKTKRFVRVSLELAFRDSLMSDFHRSESVVFYCDSFVIIEVNIKCRIMLVLISFIVVLLDIDIIIPFKACIYALKTIPKTDNSMPQTFCTPCESKLERVSKRSLKDIIKEFIKKVIYFPHLKFIFFPKLKISSK